MKNASVQSDLLLIPSYGGNLPSSFNMILS
jgi:hypothetical protein